MVPPSDVRWLGQILQSSINQYVAVYESRWLAYVGIDFISVAALQVLKDVMGHGCVPVAARNISVLVRFCDKGPGILVHRQGRELVIGPKRSGYLIGVPFHVVPELVLVRIGLGFGKRRFAETFERRLAINGTGEVFVDASLHCQLGFWLVGLLGQQAQRFNELSKPIIHRVAQRKRGWDTNRTKTRAVRGRFWIMPFTILTQT